MKVIKQTDPYGNEKIFRGPELMLGKMMGQMQAAKPDHEYEIVEMSGGRFVSLNEQRAAMIAIEEETHQGPLCPNCGREMEMDGGYPYCEYCEG